MPRMTEDEYQAIKAKVLAEYPKRKELAKKAGVKLDDQTIAELEAMLAKPTLNPIPDPHTPGGL